MDISTLKTELVPPNLKNYVESIRDIGYSPEIAVADILDNSVAAKARQISIDFYIDENASDSYLSILDDGTGMTEHQLIEAMRMATKNPNDSRAKSDLGRFGLGLKTASFSQAKQLIVISKTKSSEMCARAWDLDYIAEKNSWELLVPDDLTGLPGIDSLAIQKSGTLVIWRKVDRIVTGSPDESKHVFNTIEKHLSLVFHRFIDGDESAKKIKIIMNGREIKSTNPYLPNHCCTKIEPIGKRLLGREVPLSATMYTLPHYSKVSSREWEASSLGDYFENQGFYLYRANRLIAYGGWWGILPKKDAFKLVRVALDIDNSHDKYWSIDVKKSKANPPQAIKKRMKSIIRDYIEQAGPRPFQSRNRKIHSSLHIDPVWCKVRSNNISQYVISRSNLQLKTFIETLSQDQRKQLELCLKAIEANIPIENIYADMQGDPYSLQQSSLFGGDDKKALRQELMRQFNEEVLVSLEQLETRS